jgi:putative tributyrin esterase
VEGGKPLPKFFMTVGDDDFLLEQVEEAHAYLTDLGYETMLEVVPGYGHEWDFWDLSLRKALEDWLSLRRSVIYPE